MAYVGNGVEARCTRLDLSFEEIPMAKVHDYRDDLRDVERSGQLSEALALFDALPAVTVPAMLGSWRGFELPTGNPLDGLLEAYGWHGKRFDSVEDAHPLIFSLQGRLCSVNPAGLPLFSLRALLRLGPRLRDERLAGIAQQVMRLRRTRRPAARLRRMEYRGVSTATMIYDALPIHDHFRSVDDHILLGAMDMRGMEPPYMFVLRRER
jgi:hypothetical protein